MAMVKDVKKFAAQLNAKIFMGAPGIEGLVKPHIHVPIRGATESPFSYVAKGRHGGLSEQCRVKPGHADVSGSVGASGSRAGRGHSTVLAGCPDELGAVSAQVGF